MNENKKKTLQRRGTALTLATIMCVAALAGCGGGKKKEAGKAAAQKTPTQQSQQAKPTNAKAEADKKMATIMDAINKNAEKNKDSTKKKNDKNNTAKPAGGQSSTSKPSGNQTGANKPAGSQTGTAKPAGGQSSTSKPSGNQTGANKPAGSQTGTAKPAGGQSSTSKPSGNQTGANKPAGSQTGTNKPAGSQTGTIKPASGQIGTGKKTDASKTAKPAAPTIKTQPKDIKTAVGKTYTFTISADGTNLKYFWQVNKNDGKSWADIPGANESSYTVKNAGADQNGWQFRCVVSNDAGKAESAVATLSVDSSVKSKQG